MTDPKPTSLAEALARVGAELPHLGKDSNAPGSMGGYAYRSIESIIGVLRPVLTKYLVVVAPRTRLLEIRPAPGQKEAWQDIVIEVEFTFHGYGETIVASTIGIGRDNTDKGSNKAATQAFKTMLTEVFLIGGDSDTEAHDYSQAERAPEPPPEPAPEIAKQMLRDAMTRAEDLDAAKEAWVAASLPAIDRMTVRRLPDAVSLLYRVGLLTEAEAVVLGHPAAVDLDGRPSLARSD